MFLYVKASNWNSVIHRAKSHPKEILMFDDNGNTPLHVACQLDPPIEVLVSLKDAVAQTNSWGATPLHIAASHRCNVHALKKLIDYYPGALCRLSKMHRTPIHYACMSYRGLDLVAFQVLLEETIQEGRRLKEQHLQSNSSLLIPGCDSKITDFIDILREANDSSKDDNNLNDEEISVLLDNDSNHAVAAYSSDRSSFVDERLVSSDQTEQEKDVTFGPNANNFNIVTWKDTSGKTPLGLLFRRYRERVKRVIEVLEKMKNSSTNNSPRNSSLQTDLGHLWGKARLIVVLLTEEYQQQKLQEMEHSIGNISDTERQDDDSSASGQHWSQAASWSKERLSTRNMDKVSNELKVSNSFEEGEANSVEEKPFRIVHASVGLAGFGCPPEMVRLAMSIYPHQVREMDENGNLPLHIAATASSLGNLTSNNSIIDEESSVFSDSIVSLFSAVSSKKYGDKSYNFDSFDKVIKLLLKQYPQAAQTPHGRSGRLPLVLADRAGNRTWNDGMRTLLRAYPPALFSGSKGMISVKLYPYILSLVGGGDPQESPSKKCTGIGNLSTMNKSPSCHGSCRDNRFRGRGGIGLLNNLLLLKQRHIDELMAGATATYGNFLIRRRQNGRLNPDGESISNENLTSLKRGEPERKKRRELATTMFELLRAKPDLIENCRSHKPSLKSQVRKIGSYGRKMPPSPTNAAKKYKGGKMNDYERKQLSPRRITSEKLKERMRVFEGKAPPSLSL